MRTLILVAALALVGCGRKADSGPVAHIQTTQGATVTLTCTVN